MRHNILSSLRTYILTRIVKTFARCWLVSSRYGPSYGFTTHTRDIVFNGITYQTINGIQASDLRTSDSLTVDTLSVQTFLSFADESLVASGLFDDAIVEMFIVNYMDLSMGKLIERSGSMGEILRSDGIANFELRGLAQVLTTKVGRTFNITCNADLGDARCTFNTCPIEILAPVVVAAAPANTITRSDGGSFIDDGFMLGVVLTIAGSGAGNNVSGTIGTLSDSEITLEGVTLFNETATLTLAHESDFHQIGSVTAVISNRKEVTVSVTPANDVFTLGKFVFLTGANANFSRDIRKQTDNIVTFALNFPYDIEVGDTFEMFAGCSKTQETCKNKFDNFVNFRGFPFVPLNESIFSSPIISPQTVEEQ